MQSITEKNPNLTSFEMSNYHQNIISKDYLSQLTDGM
jgi:hypothetical protein